MTKINFSRCQSEALEDFKYKKALSKIRNFERAYNLKD